MTICLFQWVDFAVFANVLAVCVLAVAQSMENKTNDIAEITNYKKQVSKSKFILQFLLFEGSCSSPLLFIPNCTLQNQIFIHSVSYNHWSSNSFILEDDTEKRTFQLMKIEIQDICSPDHHNLDSYDDRTKN